MTKIARLEWNDHVVIIDQDGFWWGHEVKRTIDEFRNHIWVSCDAILDILQNQRKESVEIYS